MNVQSILALVGILVTTLFGLWAITAAIRFSRSVRITYAIDQIIALTDDITQNFQDLGITFRDQPVNANLVLLKGYLINTGRRDISHEMVEEQISVNLPPEFAWIDCKVVEASPSLSADTQRKSEQKIEFRTGLWKKKEYFKFEALAKVPVVEADPDNPPDEKPTVRLRRAMTLGHRIADSDRIEETHVPKLGHDVEPPTPFFLLLRFGSAKFRLIISSVIIVMGLSVGIASEIGLLSTTQLGYTLTIDDVERTVTVRVKGDKIRLSDEADFSHEMTLSEFDELFEKRATIVKRSDNFHLVFGIIYCTLGCLMLGISGLSAIRNRRMLAMISSKKEA